MTESPPAWSRPLTEEDEVDAEALVPVPAPYVSGTQEHAMYGDVAGLLAGELPDPPAPQVLRRSDGHALFYKGQVNMLFGEPESGKTWVALAAVTEVLGRGRI
jgi:hypothetical protein